MLEKKVSLHYNSAKLGIHQTEVCLFYDEITKYIDRRFGIKYEPLSQVLVTVGGSEAIDVAIRCLAGPGDEVIIPQPSFVCYEPLAEMAGAYSCTNGY